MRDIEAVKNRIRDIQRVARTKNFPVETSGDPYAFTAVDARTLMAQYPGTVNGPGSVHLYRLDSQIVIEVGTHHQGTEPNGAQKILRAITAKIHSPA
ncbi:hypothetical protein [Mycobacteroides salmoniphilum]|uniref:hypothetical protein n=1 Tax=Mycobacteroides salmoniphilum TaxID=404941 RepID=UPI001292C5C5|nr:hypothetical protein [Mycobacteroides salmoniphilum]